MTGSNRLVINTRFDLVNGKTINTATDLSSLIDGLSEAGIHKMNFEEKCAFLNFYFADVKRHISLLCGIDFSVEEEDTVTSIVPRVSTGGEERFFGAYDVLVNMSSSQQLEWRNAMRERLMTLPDSQVDTLITTVWSIADKGMYRRDLDTVLVSTLDDWQELDTLALLYALDNEK